MMLRKRNCTVSVCVALILLMVLSISGCSNGASQTKTEAPKVSAAATGSAAKTSEAAKSTFKPDKPVTAIVPAGAGGSTDLLARAIEKVWSKYCPQPLQVVDKGGAAGAEGAIAVRNSKPDGLTLLIGYGGADFVSPHFQKMEYDILNDFMPIARLSIHSNVLAVPASSPYSSLKEIIEWAKKEKKPVTSSVTLANGSVDLLVRGVGKAAGVDVTPVPTTGDAQSVTMMLGGQTVMGGASLAGAYAQIKAGKIKPIAISTKERDPVLPDVPTLIEQGIDFNQWGSVKGVAVTKNSSPEIVAYYEDLFKRICDDADFKKAMADIAEPVQYQNAADSAKFFKQVFDDFGKQVKDLGIQPQK